MRNVYSVGQVNAYIKNMFTQDFMLNRIYVKGEVSNCKYHTSGHIYFSLKDESGMIACIMFAGQRGGLSFRMQEGQQVIVLGNVTTYERDGKYQLYAKEIILDGAGALYEKFEALKQELGEMGMFAEEYKQPIPKFARTIGIVTAPTGAAIRDIINVAGRRNPYVQLLLYPALVQGEGASASIAEGIAALEKKGVDLIIVGRGGGSIEDLWAFNEEIVARAIFECRIPVISAVGHETDTTIADYVADLRAPTPSAAAELAVFEYETFLNEVEEYRIKIRKAIRQKAEWEKMKIGQYALQLKYLHPRNKLRDKQQRTVELEERFRQTMERKIDDEKRRFAFYIERMKGLSPLAKLNQGFAYISTENGKVVKTIADTANGETLNVYVTDGVIKARVEDTHKEEHCGSRK
ncbi:MAG: exodeoxyribonuclease VII large subunit [Lachnospiraceae bacterium]|nr:exodeoxyribonuclease VII large subunit [Clostridiales bacterium]MDU7632660.1 exodeoxyribonuclease VII large subunit [Lachnospiraceae bacterium]